jgi:hypothetical protein
MKLHVKILQQGEQSLSVESDDNFIAFYKISLSFFFADQDDRMAFTTVFALRTSKCCCSALQNEFTHDICKILSDSLYELGRSIPSQGASLRSRCSGHSTTPLRRSTCSSAFSLRHALLVRPMGSCLYACSGDQ